jgi:hypothetical protein
MNWASPGTCVLISITRSCHQYAFSWTAPRISRRHVRSLNDGCPLMFAPDCAASQPSWPVRPESHLSRWGSVGRHAPGSMSPSWRQTRRATERFGRDCSPARPSSPSTTALPRLPSRLRNGHGYSPGPLLARPQPGRRLSRPEHSPAWVGNARPGTPCGLPKLPSSASQQSKPLTPPSGIPNGSSSGTRAACGQPSVTLAALKLHCNGRVRCIRPPSTSTRHSSLWTRPPASCVGER